MIKSSLYKGLFLIAAALCLALPVRAMDTPPVIMNPGNANAIAGQFFALPISVSGAAPMTYSATGLPPGMYVNVFLGPSIQGTPTAGGTYTTTFSATNAGGTTSQTITFTIVVPPPPVITSALTASGNLDAPFTPYQITATNNPTSYNATGLPAGLYLANFTGQISGTPTAAGSFPITLSATNGGGTGQTVIILKVHATPVITLVNPPTSSTGNFPHYGYSQNLPLQATASNPDGTPISNVEFFSGGRDLGSGVNTGGTMYTLNFPLSTFFTSGTMPAGESIYNFNASVLDSSGQTAQSQTSSVIVDYPPTLEVQTLSTGTINQPYSAQVIFTNSFVSVTYSVSGLPSGLSINPTTGFVTGTPTETGTFNVTFTETNNAGTGSGVLPLTILGPLPPAPVITSASSATGQVGINFSYQISATNNPTNFDAASLPLGLTVSLGDGLISGIPLSSGTFMVSLSAFNRGGAGTETLTLTISSGIVPSPVITSASSAQGVSGTFFSYQIQATNSPNHFNATGLPAGLAVNTATGLISGTPSATGNSNITLSATNVGGTGTQTLALEIDQVPAPVITVNGPMTATVGIPFSYQIFATHSPTSFGATNLPNGLSISTTTGLISGTPTISGSSQITLSAMNAGGTGTNTLTLTIAAAALTAPFITSPTTAQGNTNQSFSYQIQATNNPTSFNATNLPSGLFVNTTSGLITGTPTAAGTNQVTLSASNSGGTGTTILTLTVTPSISANLSISPLIQTAAGTVVTIPVQFTAGSADASTLQFDLQIPPGVTFISATAGEVTIDAEKTLASSLVNSTDFRALVSGLNTNTIGSGVLANVQLQIASNASGTLPLHFTASSASSPAGNTAAITTTDGSLSVTGTVAVVQTLTSIIITPPAVSGKMLINTPYTFTAQAFDQNGQLMNPQPVFTWQASGPIIVPITNGVFETGTAGLYSIEAYAGTIGHYIAGYSSALTIWANNNPVAAYIRSPASGNSPLQVTFTGYDDGTIASWNWNFGDGSPPGSGKVVTHTYTTVSSSFTYLSTLTVTDNGGNTASTSLSTVVTNLRPATVTVGSVSGTPGTTVTVPITFTPSPDIGAAGGIGFEFILPPGVSYSSFTLGAVLNNAGDTSVAMAAGAGFEQFIIIGFNNTIMSQGVLASITLTLDPSLSVGSLPLNLSDVTLSDQTALITIPTTIVPGTLAVLVNGSQQSLQKPSLLFSGTITDDQMMSVGYPSGYTVQFDWTVTPLSTNGSSLALAPLETGAAASASGGARTSVGSELSFASLGLPLGRYHVQVIAVDSLGNRSQPAETDVTVIAANGDLSSVRVYPNPWRADHPTSTIIFDGLSNNSTVKLFTVSGHWVRTLSSSAGAASWDMKNDSGDRVASGLYIYLITDDQGGKVHGKLAIIK